MVVCLLLLVIVPRLHFNLLNLEDSHLYIYILLSEGVEQRGRGGLNLPPKQSLGGTQPPLRFGAKEVARALHKTGSAK